MLKGHKPETKAGTRVHYSSQNLTTVLRLFLSGNPLSPARFPWKGAARCGQAIKGPSLDPFLSVLLAQVLGCFSLLLPWEPQVSEVCASWTP